MTPSPSTSAGPASTAAPQPPPLPPAPALDIEHELVEDDPRLWIPRQKAICVFALMLGALSPTIGANVFFPALQSLEEQLHATTTSISLAVSLYILFQGTVPLVWSSISELIGRKIIFVTGSVIFAVTSLICGLANSMALLIVMRCLSATGSSPMLSIGAGTLADMYEPHQRGTMVGLYYSAPLLGPALSPVIAGALAEAFSWRATFYFVAAAGVAMIFSFTFLFKETFRPARSIAWTQAKERALRRAEAHRKEDELHPERALKRKADKARREAHPPLLTRWRRTILRTAKNVAAITRRRRTRPRGLSGADTSEKKAFRGAEPTLTPGSDSEATMHKGPVPSTTAHTPHRERRDEPFEPPRFLEPGEGSEEGAATPSAPYATAAAIRAPPTTTSRVAIAPESGTALSKPPASAGAGVLAPTPSRSRPSRGVSRTESRRSALSRTLTGPGGVVVTSSGEEITFKPSFADVNPIRPLLAVLSEPHNIVSLIASGLSFGSYYSLTLTLTRSLTAAPGSRNGGYGFSPIIVGCVLLCIGGGGMLGSILGGRLSDRRLRRIKAGVLVSPLISPTSVDAAAWRAARAGSEPPSRAPRKPGVAREEEDIEAQGAEKAPEIIVEPEERIVAAAIPMLFVPLTYVAYAWAVYYSIHIGALCVILVLLGVAQFSVYASCLSYVVDSNKGRGSSAVACNSAFRGSVAFVASQIALYLLEAMGNGWLYTGWAIALGITQLALFFVAFQGPRWRREGFKTREQDWRFLRRVNWKA